MKRRVAILGSTGSIGKQTLSVIRALSQNKAQINFDVVALTSHRNSSGLAEQVEIFKPKYVWISEEKRKEFENLVKYRGFEYLAPEEIVSLPGVDLVVVGIPGFMSTKPTMLAVMNGKDVAIASKEAIMCGGELLFSTAKRTGARILPVDSEHSSLWKMIDRYRNEIKKVYITASGGPFLKSDIKEIENATLEKVLQHPVWNMGVKITVDSALLMNKAFEIVEACYLFSIKPKDIGVKVHPEAIVHSALELKDGTFIMSAHFPDMKIPILYALCYNQTIELPFETPNIWEKPLNFFDPDTEKFPSLLLGWHCAELGQPFPCILVAADDIAVENFINGKIKLIDVYNVVKNTLEYAEKRKEELPKINSFDDIEKIFKISQKIAKEIVDGIGNSRK